MGGKNKKKQKKSKRDTNSKADSSSSAGNTQPNQTVNDTEHNNDTTAGATAAKPNLWGNQRNPKLTTDETRVGNDKSHNLQDNKANEQNCSTSKPKPKEQKKHVTQGVIDTQQSTSAVTGNSSSIHTQPSTSVGKVNASTVDVQHRASAETPKPLTKKDIDTIDETVCQLFKWLKESKSSKKETLKEKSRKFNYPGMWARMKHFLYSSINGELPQEIKIANQNHRSEPEPDYSGLQLHAEREQHKEKIDELEAVLNTLKAEKEKAENQITQLKEGKRKAEEDLEEKQAKILRLSDNNSDLSQRLAMEMSKKVSANESSVRNVSIKNRPINIADDYTMFCTNTWLEAKNCLDTVSQPSEQVKIKILDDIFKIVEPEVNELIDLIAHDTNQVLKKLHKHVEFKTTPHTEKTADAAKKMEYRRTIAVWAIDTKIHTEKQPSKKLQDEHEISTPTEVKIALMDFLRTTSDIVDLKDLVKIVIDKIDKEFNNKTDYRELWKAVKDNDPVKVYIQHMVKLVWKMVIQSPQMTFKFSDKWLGDDKQDLFWGSADPKRKNNDWYEVYPMLFHGERMMAKGKVLCLESKSKINSTCM